MNKAFANDEESTLGRIFEESSTHEEDEVCLEVSHEKDGHKVTKLSYK